LTDKPALTNYSWSLDNPKLPVFRRQKLLHKIIDNSTFSNSASFDDEVTFNTQAGSQWDGLRHAVYRKKELLYIGVSKEEIQGPKSTDVLGINSKFIFMILFLAAGVRKKDSRTDLIDFP